MEALLRFSGKRGAKSSSENSTLKSRVTSDNMNDSKIHSRASKTIEKQPTLSPGSSGEKRKSSEERDVRGPPNKRQRTSNSTIANRPTSKSPVSKHEYSYSRKQLLAPSNNGGKSVPMSRVASGEGEKTPAHGLTSSTPGTASKTIKSFTSTPGDGQVNKSRDAERRAWRDEFQKYVGLGRDLKHASQRHSGIQKGSKEQTKSADEKLAVVVGVEAVLCFILAFVADDRSKSLARQAGDSGGWRSIVAYWQVVKSMASPYPHLQGLCSFLGAISHDSIHSLDLERLATSSLPLEQSPAPTPGSDGNTITSEENKKLSKEFFELKTRLIDSYREARSLWLQGTRELSHDILSQHYPATWSKRFQGVPERGQEKLKLRDYSGPYFLPLNSTTSPLEAVRFGLSFLAEWTEIEGVDWKPKLML